MSCGHVFVALLLFFSPFAITLHGQDGPPPPPPGQDDRSGPPLHEHGPPRKPPDRLEQTGPSGKWWNDSSVIQHLGLSTEQRKRIEALFQSNRLHLIDLSATLEKEDAVLEPLLDAEHPDEARILSQIDRIAQARAELEKANARFVLGIRSVLTPDQWRHLQTQPPGPPPDRKP